jgi:hypothetical protein
LFRKTKVEEDQKTVDEIQTTAEKPEAPIPPTATSSTTTKIEKVPKSKKIDATKLRRRKMGTGAGPDVSGGESTGKSVKCRPSRQHSSQNQSRYK